MKPPGKPTRSVAGPRDRPPTPGRLSPARDEAIAVLSECFAQDRMTLEDFERRVALVQEARSTADLRAALDGLHAARGAIKAPAQAPAPVAGYGRRPARIAESDRAIAVFGEATRMGAWTPALETRAIAVMGSVVIDLRDARLASEDVFFTAVTFMGSVEFIVPPGLAVECSGSAIVGSFESDSLAEAAGPGPPTVHIGGFATLGSIEIEVRHPGESKRDARKRRRIEARRLRLARRESPRRE